MLATLDARDAIYLVVGLALFALTLQPALGSRRWFNLPLFYVLAGTLFGGIAVIRIDPVAGGLQAKVIEHASELIVIISLAGAGLAIDTVESWRSWNPTWRLLLVTMPLTMAAVAFLGHAWLGLTLPGALLLAAALAPTDPVLARSVQVSPPGQREEPMEVALTAEAGLNDGLAFPFVYFAVHAAALGTGAMLGSEAWLWDWMWFDLLYRVAAGVGVGFLVGRGLSWAILSRWGDASTGAWNAVVVILASTMLSYGAAEAVDGYGFLAVFVAMRSGRSRTRGTEDEGYERFAHHGAEQLEAILLAVLLLWLGTFIGGGALAGLRWQEVAFALALVLLIRPAAGLVALVGLGGGLKGKRKVAFFGIRGMGSVFYIAYAQTHADFVSIDAVWRIAAVTIVASIVIHGYAANLLLPEDEPDEEVHPHRRGGRPGENG
ncbi:cation:proton antiporter [Jannaschia sp. W003]|uniref:cation:proton antiporter domain-containing protein n=1 Tax=Jannaschia sp. W003 TaxID=2867012 RepID=UPI0021A7A116|nr:cation:proton antiporter [Jannaschia sp. W003]UWQ21189.1 cation:proton antiporter [Jannaschia sp. W003]